MRAGFHDAPLPKKTSLERRQNVPCFSHFPACLMTRLSSSPIIERSLSRSTAHPRSPLQSRDQGFGKGYRLLVLQYSSSCPTRTAHHSTAQRKRGKSKSFDIGCDKNAQRCYPIIRINNNQVSFPPPRFIPGPTLPTAFDLGTDRPSFYLQPRPLLQDLKEGFPPIMTSAR